MSTSERDEVQEIGDVPLGGTTMPEAPPESLDEQTYAELRDLVAAGGVLALTGAGMSTASGIPDYRGPTGVRRVQPMTFAQFTKTAANRRRYWARSYLGWPVFRAALPNAGHEALARLQGCGFVEAVITQNVDRLHQRAGSSDVIELHGSLERVVCLNCGEDLHRDDMQEQLRAANPEFVAEMGQLRPDGDVDLPAHVEDSFRLVTCRVCRSDLLKPDVVFFGESVPKVRVEQCYDLVAGSHSHLVLGSSLAVMSSYRFVRRAHQLGIPVASVTRGWTRGSAEITLGIDHMLTDVLTRLADDLTPNPSPSDVPRA